jgi:hypothetical protein
MAKKFLTDDEFDKGQVVSAKRFIPDEEFESPAVLQNAEEMEYDNPLAAGALGAGQQLSFGYLPQLKAAGEVGLEKVKNVFGDKNPDKKYVESRDQFAREIDKYKKYNPKSFTTGEVAGILGSVPLMGAGMAKAGLSLAKPAAGLIGRLGQGAISGAAQSALYNPGDVEGVVDPLQVSERVNNAKTGAIFGAAGQGVGEVAGKAVGKLKEIPKKLEKAGYSKALKSAGAMLKDFRAAANRGRIDDLGKEMVEEGMVYPGASFDDVRDIAAGKVDEVGSKIGQIYDKIGMMPQNPTELGNKLTQSVAKNLPKLNKEGYANTMKEIVDEIVADPSVLSGDVRELNKIISNLDDRINWSKQTNQMPELQKGYVALRNTLREEINNIAERSGSKELAELNRKYGRLVEIRNIAKDRVLRDESNRMFGLTDTILGGAGLAAGLAGGELDGEGLLKSGLIGLGSAGLSKLGRTYGPAVMTKGLIGAGKAAGSVQGLLDAAAPRVMQDGVRGLLTNPNSQLINRLNSEKNRGQK